QEETERHVAHQLGPYRSLELAEQRLLPLPLAHGGINGEREIPIPCHVWLAARADREHVTWRKLLDPGQDRVGRRNVLKVEVPREVLEVELSRHRRMRQQRAQLGPEDKCLVARVVIERLSPMRSRASRSVR